MNYFPPEAQMYLQFVMPQNIFLIKYNVPHAGYEILDEDILKSPVLNFPSPTHLVVSFYILRPREVPIEKSPILYFSSIIESFGVATFCRSLNNNSFSGPIPNSIGNLSKLRRLDLTNNQLSGSLPVSSGNLSGLDMLVHTKHLYVLSF